MVFPFALFLVLVGCIEVGRRLGAGHDPEEHEEARAGLGVMESAVFALFGLLLAFAFSGAAARFDVRRQQIIDEANAVGTLWLRLDLLPTERRPALQELVRGYTDARLAVYASVEDREAATARAAQLQGPLWTEALAACRAEGPAMTLLVPALNDVFDEASRRAAATKVHPPLVVFLLLYLLALACALQAGWRLGRAKQRHRAQVLGFAGVVALTLGITTDLEFPRYGYIRLDDYDVLLADVRQGMR